MLSQTRNPFRVEVPFGKPSNKVLLALSATATIATTTWMVWNYRYVLADGLTWLSDQDAVVAYMEQFGIGGPVLLMALIALQVFVSLLPGRMLMIASGYIYGPIGGSLITIIPTVLASMGAFYLARSGLRPLVEKMVPAHLLERWQKIADKQGFSFYCIVFLLPVFPADALCYVAGMTKISGRRFLAASFVGRVPLTVLMPILGAYGKEMTTIEWAAIIGGNLLLVVIGKLVSNKITSRAKNQEQLAGNPSPVMASAG